MEDPGSQKGKEPRGQVWVGGERVGRGSEKGGGRRGSKLGEGGEGEYCKLGEGRRRGVL